MTASIRYKEITNPTPSTAMNRNQIPYGDGDDKTIMMLLRQYSYGDCGTDPNQTRHAGPNARGAVICNYKPETNIILLEARTYFTSNETGIIYETLLDNYIHDNENNDIQPSTISYIFNTSDNTIRALDRTLDGGRFIDDLCYTILTLLVGPGIPWLSDING